MPANIGSVETYRVSPTRNRVIAVLLAVGGIAQLVATRGWGLRVLGAVGVFLGITTWFGVNKRAVFQTDQFLVLRGAMFSRRLEWEQVASAHIARRGVLFFGLVVVGRDGRKFTPDSVGYYGLRRRDDAPVNELAASINARAQATATQSATG